MNIILLPPECVSLQDASTGGNSTIRSGSIRIPRNSNTGRHITGVLRSAPGDLLKVGILDGPRGTAKVLEIGESEIRLDGQFSFAMDNPNSIILGVGYSRPISMKRILREAAMLGALEVWLYPTELGEKSYRTASIWRDGKYRNFLVDGASQGGGSYIPRIRFLSGIEHVVATFHGDFPLYTPLVCDLTPDSVPFLETFNPKGTLICIGSERGWSEGERREFRTARFRSVTLGQRILRTETACALALGVGEMFPRN